MNILGEGFPNTIIDQIHQRQKIYGSGYNGSQRSAEQLIYLNANTSWCKLVSSVDIEDPKDIVNQSLSGRTDIGSNNLAKKFVLFNGVNDISSGDNQRSGVSTNNDILGNNNAYGIGGTDFGIRPMMGIQSANIKHENRGSIRRATVKIKAFNKIQFDIIDTLYLRLGFNILLEWGHSIYYDNKGVLQTKENNSLADDFLSGKGLKFIPTPPGGSITGPYLVPGTNVYSSLTYEDFLKKIADQKIISNGNYDAMFAKVTNYHWSFLPDGSYDITLDLVSIGDVVESFKINALVDGLTIAGATGSIDSNAKDIEIINHYADKNSIGKFFYNTLHSGSASIVGGSSSSATPGAATGASFISKEITTNKIDAIVITYNNLNFKEYIRLGTLLQFFQEKLMYYFKVGSDYSPMLKFDYDEQSNLMYVGDLQVSIDPNICAVNRTLNLDGNDYPFAPTGEPFESTLLGPSYGQVMNIYISMKWILLKLDELKDASSNKVVLIDLLNNMLSAINGALGGTNALEATIDDSTNTVIIRDMNPLPNTKDVIEKLNGIGKTIPDKYAYFDLYGYSNAEHPVDPSIYKDPTNPNQNLGHASFIKDFNFTTEISPELSTMLTIGATANSTVVGENSTAFSKFNIGLKDRFKEEIVYTSPLPPPMIGGFNTGPIQYFPQNPISQNVIDMYKAGQEQQALIDDLEIKYYGTFTAFKTYLKNLSNRIYNGDAETYKDAITNYTNYLNQLKQAIMSKIAKEKKISLSSILPSFAPGTGFIPFNMSLTMDGLSGMKIYSKFFVDTRYLPTNYPDNAEFLIKNIEHKIENNKWFTTIESIVISKGDIDPKQLSKKVNITGTGGNGGFGGAGANTSYVLQFTTPPPGDLVFSKFIFPTTGIVSSKVGLRPVQNGRLGSDQHRAIDISAPKGTPVYSSTNGIVSRIGASGYGPNCVIIEIKSPHALLPILQKWYIIYGHMDTSTVKVGDTVTAGQQIGTVGDKDSPGAYHLHFQIRNVLNGMDSTGLSIDINNFFPSKLGNIVAKQPFL